MGYDTDVPVAISPLPGCVQLAVFVLEHRNGKLGGFIEGDLRRTLAHSSRIIGYIGSWYVEPDLRRQQWGSRLIRVLEDWVIRQGYTEMGSDCLETNAVSYIAHTANGYQETRRGYEDENRLIYFSKSLQSIT